MKKEFGKIYNKIKKKNIGIFTQSSIDSPLKTPFYFYFWVFVLRQISTKQNDRRKFRLVEIDYVIAMVHCHLEILYCLKHF